MGMFLGMFPLTLLLFSFVFRLFGCASYRLRKKKKSLALTCLPLAGKGEAWHAMRPRSRWVLDTAAARGTRVGTVRGQTPQQPE